VDHYTKYMWFIQCLQNLRYLASFPNSKC
jgi:hypothetical protein